MRAPIEFAQGHVPGALNLPLFTDEERARIGTTYKQVSQERAVHLGLEFFGPKMSGLVKLAQKLAPGKEVRLHCWRGGMRSGAVLWLLELAGFRVHLLDHGYKDYRRAVLASFATAPAVAGAGRPHRQRQNRRAAPAGRPGPARARPGGAGPPQGLGVRGHRAAAQPTQEQFENNLAAALAALPTDAPIWVEDESRQIGRLTIPPALFAQLHAAPRVVLEVPRAARVAKLAAEYGAEDPALLAEAIERLHKRLGGLATQQALAAVAAGNFPLMVELVLDYYDKTYTYGLAPRPGEPARTLVARAGLRRSGQRGGAAGGGRTFSTRSRQPRVAKYRRMRLGRVAIWATPRCTLSAEYPGWKKVLALPSRHHGFFELLTLYRFFYSAHFFPLTPCLLLYKPGSNEPAGEKLPVALLPFAAQNRAGQCSNVRSGASQLNAAGTLACARPGDATVYFVSHQHRRTTTDGNSAWATNPLAALHSASIFHFWYTSLHIEHQGTRPIHHGGEPVLHR